MSLETAFDAVFNTQHGFLHELLTGHLGLVADQHLSVADQAAQAVIDAKGVPPPPTEALTNAQDSLVYLDKLEVDANDMLAKLKALEASIADIHPTDPEEAARLDEFRYDIQEKERDLERAIEGLNQMESILKQAPFYLPAVSPEIVRSYYELVSVEDGIKGFSPENAIGADDLAQAIKDLKST